MGVAWGCPGRPSCRAAAASPNAAMLVDGIDGAVEVDPDAAVGMLKIQFQVYLGCMCRLSQLVLEFLFPFLCSYST